MRKVLGWWLVVAVVGCDAPEDACRTGGRELGAQCYPEEAMVRVGYGFEPTELAAVDLDADGRPDIVGVSPAKQTLMIAWGGVDKEAATSWGIGEEVAGLALGDVDGDGSLDLVTALPASDALAVMHGRGGRRFAAMRRVAVGDTPRAVITADLDGDGVVELVAANVGDGSVSVVRGEEAKDPVIVGTGPHALAAGDLDGDGAVDVAVALADDDAVQVLRGDGAGGLLVGERHAVGFGPLAVVVADLDGDTKLDLATADTLADTVTLLRGDGKGGVVERTTWPAPGMPRRLVVVPDAEGPLLGVLGEALSELGLLDPRTGGLATTATTVAAGGIVGHAWGLYYGGAATLGILERGAKPGLQMTAHWQVGGEFRLIMTGDLDGDGVDDVVLRETSMGALKILSGSDGRVMDVKAVLPGEWQSDVTGSIADVDGDGRLDLTFYGPVAIGVEIVTLRQDSGGDFVAGERTRIDVYSYAVATGDVDGDGRVDFVFEDGDYRGGRWLVRNDGAGGWSGPEELGRSQGVHAFELVDFDKDGKLDLIGLTNGYVVRTRDVATATVDEPWVEQEPTEWWAQLATGDLNGDGELDVVVCGSAGVRWIGDYSGQGLIFGVHEGPCRDVFVRDVEGDGDLDLLVVPSVVDSQGEVPSQLVWLANDGGYLQPRSRQVLPPLEDIRVVSVGDGDAPDLILEAGFLVRAYTGRFGPALVERISSRSFGAEEQGSFADLDGDGLLDRVQVGPGLAAALAIGEGKFGPWQHVPPAMVPGGHSEILDHAVGDVDGDGAAEVLLLAREAASRRVVTAVHVDADGSIRVEPVIDRESGAGAVLVTDHDADGRDEVIVVDDGFAEVELVVLRALAEGGFAEVAVERVPVAGAAIGLNREVHGLVRFDGDARSDLVVYGDTGMLVARGLDSGGFAQAIRWPRRSWPTSLAIRDLDGDRVADVVSIDFSGRLLLQRGAADGGPLAAATSLMEGVSVVTAADLDGDGSQGVVAVRSGVSGYPTMLFIGRMTADGGVVFRERAAMTGERSDVTEVRVGHFDEDDAPDIALVDGDGFTIVRQAP